MYRLTLVILNWSLTRKRAQGYQNGLDIEEELMEEIEATTKKLRAKFYKKKLKELE